MELKTTDAQFLQHILRYIYEVETSIRCMNITEYKFKHGFAYRNAISMPIMQIGECVKHLSEDFRSAYQEIPWKQVAGMRDFFAHDYGRMNTDEVWNVATNDLSVLRDFCSKTLTDHQEKLPVPQPFMEDDEIS